MRVDDPRYIGVTFSGSRYPDAPYRNDLSVILRPAEKNEYVPVMNRVCQNKPLGLKLFITGQTHQEGFWGRELGGERRGSRSYKSRNPGNIGNDDDGKTIVFPTLEQGVERQLWLLDEIINGRMKAYPMGKEKIIKPKYSKEIANHPEYGLPANLPGYKFIFTGQLDQYVKIYATGARAGNGYINNMVSWFKLNGLTITPESKIQDIILMK